MADNKIKNYKLPLSFLLIILLFFLLGAFTIKGLFTIGDLTRTLYEHPLVVSNASLNAALNMTKMHRSMKDVVLANFPDEMAKTLEDLDQTELKVYGQLDAIQKGILGEKGQDLEKQTRQLFRNWKPIRKEVVRLLKSGDKQQAVRITKVQGAEHVARLEHKMLELTSYARQKADNFMEFAETSLVKFERVIIFLTFSGVLLSVIIAFMATNRVLKSEKVLWDEKDKLKKALDEIKTLRGIIPICSHCKQIRDNKGKWKNIEEYIHTRSEASFSHGICPDCIKKLYPGYGPDSSDGK